MNQKFIQAKVDAKRAIANAVDSFASEDYYMELIQNAKRAGAKRIGVVAYANRDAQYGAEPHRVARVLLGVVHDGKTFDLESLEAAISPHAAGWSAEVLNHEHPAGLGLSGMLYARDTRSALIGLESCAVTTADFLVQEGGVTSIDTPEDWKKFFESSGFTCATLVELRGHAAVGAHQVKSLYGYAYSDSIQWTLDRLGFEEVSLMLGYIWLDSLADLQMRKWDTNERLSCNWHCATVDIGRMEDYTSFVSTQSGDAKETQALISKEVFGSLLTDENKASNLLLIKGRYADYSIVFSFTISNSDQTFAKVDYKLLGSIDWYGKQISVGEAYDYEQQDARFSSQVAARSFRIAFGKVIQDHFSDPYSGEFKTPSFKVVCRPKHEKDIRPLLPARNSMVKTEDLKLMCLELQEVYANINSLLGRMLRREGYVYHLNNVVSAPTDWCRLNQDKTQKCLVRKEETEKLSSIVEIGYSDTVWSVLEKAGEDDLIVKDDVECGAEDKRALQVLLHYLDANGMLLTRRSAVQRSMTAPYGLSFEPKAVNFLQVALVMDPLDPVKIQLPDNFSAHTVQSCPEVYVITDNWLCDLIVKTDEAAISKVTWSSDIGKKIKELLNDDEMSKSEDRISCLRFEKGKFPIPLLLKPDVSWVGDKGRSVTYTFDAYDDPSDDLDCCLLLVPHPGQSPDKDTFKRLVTIHLDTAVAGMLTSVEEFDSSIHECIRDNGSEVGDEDSFYGDEYPGASILALKRWAQSDTSISNTVDSAIWAIVGVKQTIIEDIKRALIAKDLDANIGTVSEITVGLEHSTPTAVVTTSSGRRFMLLGGITEIT